MIVAVMNNKGGVGKTTSAVNLSAAWAHAGQRTLLVDLDSQCSASLHLGLRHGVGNKGNVKLAEASSFGQSIFEYDRRCPGARLYQSLSDELEEKCREFALVA